jgi:hypothetical protein
MGTRGKRSTASLSVVSELPQRPPPPAELTPEEAAEWKAAVGTMPATWCSGSTIPLLTQYVRHIVQARRLAEEIARVWGDPAVALADRARLLTLQGIESRTIATIATKLRMTPQSRYRPNSAVLANEKGTPRPWEI